MVSKTGEATNMAIGEFRGGSVVRLRPTPYCIPMSTAISRVYTKDGFVVAADGRAQNSEDGSIISDSTQKIFLINQPNISLAYSLAGTVGITPEKSDNVIFDFYDESRRAVESKR